MKEQRFDKQPLNSAIKFKSTNMLLEEFISDYFKRHPEAKHTSQAERRLKREFYLSNTETELSTQIFKQFR